MELKSLQETDLREATFPLARSAPSNFLPALRTPAYLRELVQTGVIDAALSKVVTMGGHVVACCLVQRMQEGCFVSGLGVASLATQRGALRALLEAIIAEARRAQMHHICIEVNEAEAGPQGALQTAGFLPIGHRYRMARLRLPDRSLLPPQDQRPSVGGFVPISTDEALAFAAAQKAFAPSPGSDPFVLGKLRQRLLALAWSVDGQIQATAVLEPDRKLLLLLAGELLPMQRLAVFSAAHHSAAFADSLAEQDPARQALPSAGFDTIAVRTGMRLDLPES